MNKIVLKSACIVFIFLASICKAQLSIISNPTNRDYCTSTTVSYSVGSANPGHDFRWSFEDDNAFIQGIFIYTQFASGPSIQVSPGQFGQKCMTILVEEFDLQGAWIASASTTLGGNQGNSIPIRVDNNSCGDMYVPAAYNSFSVSGRWSGWYKNGVLISTNNPILYTPPAGTYQFKLKLACGDTITSAPVTLANPIVQPVLTNSGNLNVCIGDTVTLGVQTAYYSYQWNKNGAVIAGATGATYKATTSGTYTVTTNGDTNPNNTCVQTSNPLIVNVQNGAFITPSATSICGGDSVKLTCTSASSYVWKRNGVTIAGANTQTIYVKQTGNYTVTTTGLGSCNSSVKVSVTVYQKPTITINQTSPQTICNGSGIDLTTTATNSTTFQWTLNNVNIIGATQSSYFATQAGNYRCIVTNIIGCPKISSPLNIVSNASNTLPIKSVTLSPGAAGGKDSYVESYNASGSNFGTAQYMDVSNFYKYFRTADRALLQFDLSSIPADAYINAASLKLYVDTVAVWTSPSQGLLLQRVIQPWNESLVNWNNQPSVSSFKSIVIPRDSVYRFGSPKANVKDLVIFWQKHIADNNGVSISMLNESIGGPYGLVRLGTSDNATGSKRPKLTISYTAATITAAGPLSFCAGDSVKLTADAGPYTYKWYKNNNVIASATGINYKAKTAGSYYVVLTNATGCTAKSATVTVSVPCRISDLENEISVSPNPSSDNFTLNTDDGSPLKNVKVFDADGRLVEFIDHIESGSAIGERWNAGVYILSGEQSKKIRLIKL